MRVGIAADHGGFFLKNKMAETLREAGHEVVDFGNDHHDPDDDYPDYVIPLARAVAGGEVARGIAVCGSGVGACIAANKIAGARAALVHDLYEARQGVEDDDMNIICLGGRVIGAELANQLAHTFLGAEYKATERYQRRLDKIAKLEQM